MNVRCAIVAFTLLSGSTVSAVAGWEKIVEENSADIYVDRASIARVGGLAIMKSLTNLKAENSAAAQSMSFRSTTQDDEYDCWGKRIRLKRFSLYVSFMAQGSKGFTSDQDSAWQPVSGNEVNILKWQIACSNR